MGAVVIRDLMVLTYGFFNFLAGATVFIKKVGPPQVSEATDPPYVDLPDLKKVITHLRGDCLRYASST